jgi:hypothetical protein
MGAADWLPLPSEHPSLLIDDLGDSRALWQMGGRGSVVVGSPGTVADELQLFLGQADQSRNKDLPTGLYPTTSVLYKLWLLPVRIRAGFLPETSHSSGRLTKNLTIERYE